MKSRFTFLTACICLCTFLFIELPAQTVFQMSFSNGIYMCGKDVILSNGYYYIGGTAKTSTASDFLLIKTDNYGDTIRTLSFHANLPIEGKQILVRNGDVYLLGNCNPGTTLSKGFLAKIRDNGQVLWSRIYGGTGTFEFANALFADDTSIAITGTHTGSGPGGKDILFAQFDTAGIFISSRAYGAANEGGNSITGNREQGFYITGTTDNNDSQGDIFILNLDPNGMQAFCKTYNIVHSSSYSGQHGYSIIRTNNNQLAVSGDTKVYEFTPTDQIWNPLIMKCDLTGNVIYATDYSLNSGGGPAYKVIETADNHFAFSGYMRSSYSTLIKTTELGAADWGRIYGTSNIGSGGDENISSSLLQDGNSYVLTGYIITPVDTSLFLIKSNSMGESGCYFTDPPLLDPFTDTPTVNNLNLNSVSVNIPVNDLPLTVSTSNASVYTYCNIPTGVDVKTEELSISPNPAREYLHLQGFSSDPSYQLINSMGDVVKAGQGCIIDVRDLSPAMYFLRVNGQGVFTNFKVVISK